MKQYLQTLDLQKRFKIVPVASTVLLIVLCLISFYPAFSMKASLKRIHLLNTEINAGVKAAGDALNQYQASSGTEQSDNRPDKTFKNLLAEIENLSDAQIKAEKDIIGRTALSLILFPVICIILIVLSFLGLAFINNTIKQSIITPVSQMVEYLGAISKGNMSKRAEVTSKDLIGDMGNHFNAAMERLHDTIVQFSKSCVVLSLTSRNLDKNSREMKDSILEIVEQVTPVAAASEQMAGTTTEISENCLSAAESSETANTAAVSGERIVKQTIEAIGHINDFVKESAAVIEKLKTRSTDIGNAVGVIDAIALQTNILALNATIEAARAGEAGKGFAVVADEIKKLSTQTTQATQKIEETVEAINNETQLAVQSMENGLGIVEKGVSDATQSGEALQNILEQISIVTTQISQIAEASEGQSGATDEIAKNVQQISNIIKDTKDNVSQNADAAASMADLSVELKKLVGQFKFARPEDAEKMIQKAYDYAMANGREKALSAFNDPGGDFVDGELFIFAQDYKGNFLAYGGNPELVGVNVYDQKDHNGKYMGRDMIEIAKTKGSGWYEYAYVNPQTEVVEDKLTFLKNVDGYYIGCGIFK